ncbi:hypothetical protein IFM89_006415 [Coptis chinensis]|uniref:F-box domain-containing protein n=1 Tax=Coptis chinensis TaxID=261450 RepID=A0A835LYS3_9MAGN|nr:hypothetical protein IFM89_006415 [Coptis chinensis]
MTSVFPPDSSMKFGGGGGGDRFLMEDNHYHHHQGEPNDIIDLLPSDPFGMNVAATFGAITGCWFDYFQIDALNSVWNNSNNNNNKTVMFPVFGDIGMYECFNNNNEDAVGFDGWVEKKGVIQIQQISNGLSPTTGAGASNIPNKEILEEVSGSCSSGDAHEALFFAFGYMSVQDLLNVERVCKSFRSAVYGDPLLWRNICIHQPLNERIEDDGLVRLTGRAQGNLQSLSLVKCSRVTDVGLKCVLQSNPRLTMLNVPECTRISIGGIVDSLKALKSSGAPGLKHLRIGGRYDVTHEHFEELKALLNIDNCVRSKVSKPRIYHGHSFPSYDEDDHDIDVEICPRCENLRLVYDCPVDCCEVRQSSPQSCRACTICIPRCVQCGRCVLYADYVETFCLDILCLKCFELQKEERGASSNHISLDQVLG